MVITTKKIPKLRLILFISFLVFSFATGSFIISFKTTLFPIKLQVSDPNATENAKSLFYNLADLSDKVLFGHQDTNFYGLNATDPENLTLWSDWGNFTNSDVLILTGSYPAVYGFDVFMSSAYMVPAIKAAFERGGVITVSWHASNFVTGGSFYDTSGSVVSKILPGGSHHENFTVVLDDIAANLGNLEHLGESIPIIFRPWHEYNGDWFWWCQPYCSTDEFKQLYRFTVEYLRNVKGVHNFLYAISPNQPLIPYTANMYLERYPGDDVVDILALDAYHSGESKWKESVSSSLRTIIRLAFERGKLTAFSETGLGGGLSETYVPNWYADVLLDMFLKDPLFRTISYVLVWRNANYDHFWVPYPGHHQAAGFLEFYNSEYIIFGNSLPSLYSENMQADRYLEISKSFLISHNAGVYLGLISVSILLAIPIITYIFKVKRRGNLSPQ